MKRFVVLSLLVGITGLGGCAAVAVPQGPTSEVAIDPNMVVEEAAVPEVSVTEYVFITGRYYYWHPTGHYWVHADRPYGWIPPQGIHVQQMAYLPQRPVIAHHNGPMLHPGVTKPIFNPHMPAIRPQAGVYPVVPVPPHIYQVPLARVPNPQPLQRFR